MKPYYERDGITIYHADCRDVLPTIDTIPIDLVVTSPPYNMGLIPGGNGRGMYRPGASSKSGRFRSGYGTHDDAMDEDEYGAWQREILASLWHLIQDDGAIFYNHRPRVIHGRFRPPLDFDFGGVPLRQVITWDRGTGIDVGLRQYCSAYEWVLVFAKPGWKLVSHAASGMGNVWRLGMEYAETAHPSPFPLSLLRTALLTTGAATVLDPFMGSGTTLRAAKDLGRKAVGIEIEERYCEIAVRRLEQAVLPLGVPA